MKTLLQFIKMIKLKNLLAGGVLLMAGSVFAQFEPPPAPTLKTLVAGTDTLNIMNPNGGTVNLLLNDFADAVNITAANLMPSADSLGIALTNDAGLTANVSLDGTTGVLTVFGSPVAGTYSLNYQICQLIFAPTGCATGTINLTVTATSIIAGADSATLASSATQISILSNDFLGPAIPATTSTVTVTIVSDGGLTGLSFDSGLGVLVVPTRTPGTYTPTYKICQTASPTNCSATVTVTITAVATLVATADSGSVVTGVGGTVSILANDTSSGAAATTTNVTPTISVAVAGFSINGSGQLAVASTVAVGSYPITYKICQVGNLTNCSAEVIATVAVAAAPAVLIANPDSGSLAAGVGATFSIITNDTSNGLTATSATVAVTNLSELPIGITHNGSGLLTVATTLAAGVYPLTYKICEVGNLTNCSATAAVTVTITAASATLVATADSGSVVAGTGGTVSILTNDTSNGAAATTTNVTPSIVTPVTGFSINGTGQLAVATTVAAGSYPVTYKICEVGNLTNCSATVTVTVTITAASATLVATADSGSVVAGTGGTVSILANDTSNGTAATTTTVVASIVTPVTGFSINGAGQLAVATTVTAGSYPVTYKICEVGNLTNCSATVTVTVTVTAAPVVGGAGFVLAVDAITMPVTGGSLNVLTNDRFNSVAIPTSSVILTLTDSAGASGATLSPTGDLFVPTGLAQRVYLMSYKVCLVSAPTTCATTTASISISAAVTSATVKVPSVPGATASNANVITTTSSTGGSPLSFSTGSSSGGSTTAGSGSINDPLTFTGARVSFGDSITGFATVRLYSSQDIPKFVTQLNFNGAGTFNAHWVVIRPGDQEPNEFDLLPEGSLSAQQKLQRNRNYPVIDRTTGYASGGSYLLAGPDPSKLPKSIPGIYRILLRLEGFGSFAMPALRYIVQSGNPPAPRTTSLATAAAVASTPQVSVASIATTLPIAGTQFPANGIGAVVNLAWNWGASQSATAVSTWHYEIYYENERVIRMAGGNLKPDIRNFRIMLPSNFFAGKNLRWVVYGRDKDKQVIARSADMFFSIVAANQ